jgi:hypothetical protein
LSSDIISKIKLKLSSLFYNIISDKKYEFKGFYYYKNNIYLFFDFSNCKLIINSIYKTSIIWPVLTDEIINKKTTKPSKIINPEPKKENEQLNSQEQNNKDEPDPVIAKPIDVI